MTATDGHRARVSMDGRAVSAFAAAPYDWRWQSLGLAFDGVAPRELLDQGGGPWAPGLLLPAMTVTDSAIEHNIDLMATWCEQRAVLLAPHAKTTLAPQIMWRQAQRGCWAFTCATPGHLRIYRQFGVDRIFYANELVQEDVVRWLLPQLGDLQFSCLVDSVDGVDFLAGCVARAGGDARLDVLVERGHSGGRAGVRDVEQAVAVAARAAASPGLRLIGVEAFEGLLGGGAGAGGRARAEAFLDDVRETYVAVSRRGLLAEADVPLLSAGGSAFFDLVHAAAARDWPPDVVTPRLVLRSGCYVTHDDGLYARLSPFGGRATGDGSLRSAIVVWGAVLSRPEPGFAIIGAGKREMGSDIDYPVPLRAHARDSGRVVELPGARTSALSDHHAHIHVSDATSLGPGDVVAFGVSHPCTTFDRWRAALLVDDEDRPIDILRTCF